MRPKKKHRAAGRTAPSDVVIVGGGVMGCASAWLLARAGLAVTVLERSVPGAEASSAAAGILGVSAEAHAPGAMSELAQKSGALYPAFCAALGRDTGIDVEYRPCGVLRVAFSPAEARALGREGRAQRGKAKALSAQRLRQLVPELSAELELVPPPWAPEPPPPLLEVAPSPPGDGASDSPVQARSSSGAAIHRRTIGIESRQPRRSPQS